LIEVGNYDILKTGCQTGLYNRFDNRLYRVNGALGSTDVRGFLTTAVFFDTAARWRISKQTVAMGMDAARACRKIKK